MSTTLMEHSLILSTFQGPPKKTKGVNIFIKFCIVLMRCMQIELPLMQPMPLSTLWDPRLEMAIPSTTSAMFWPTKGILIGLK